jgi:hypothetical protein
MGGSLGSKPRDISVQRTNSQDFNAMILAVMETVTRIILHYTLKQLG